TDSYESESPANEKNCHVWAIPENNERGRTGAAAPHPNSAAKRFADHSWHIAPSQDVLGIRYNPKAKQRSLDAVRWGLILYWAKEPKIACKTINARAEPSRLHRVTAKRSRRGAA